MPSNKELMTEAQELAAKLGISVRTTGLNNAALVELVADLKAKERDAELDTQADDAAPVQAPEPEPDPRGYVVAKGCAVTNMKGVLAEGDAVEPRYFKGGEKDFARLVETGHIVKG